MAQVQQDNQDADPITQSFIVDRQAFWNRFTGFTTNVVIGLAVLLVLLWWFVA